METQLVDDLDGGAAVATVCFSLDGRSFEIDLSEGNLAELRTALEPFVRVARPAPGDGAPRRNARPSAAASAVSTDPPAPEPEVAASSGVSSSPSSPTGRRRVPVIADPFNPSVRSV